MLMPRRKTGLPLSKILSPWTSMVRKPMSSSRWSSPGFHLNAVELGMLGRPANQVLRRKRELGVAIAINGGLLVDRKLGNPQRDDRTGACATICTT